MKIVTKLNLIQLIFRWGITQNTSLQLFDIQWFRWDISGQYELFVSCINYYVRSSVWSDIDHFGTQTELSHSLIFIKWINLQVSIVKANNQICHHIIFRVLVHHLLILLVCWISNWVDGRYKLFGLELNLFGYLLDGQYPEFSRLIVSCTDQYVFILDHVPNVFFYAVLSDSCDGIRLELIKLVVSFTCVISNILAIRYSG